MSYKSLYKVYILKKINDENNKTLNILVYIKDFKTMFGHWFLLPQIKCWVFHFDEEGKIKLDW